MKSLKLNLLLLFISAAIAASAQNSNQEPFLTKSFANAAIKNVNVKTSGGSILIAGGSAADAHVEVYVNANNNGETVSKDELTQRMKDYELDVSLNGTELEVMAKAKSNFNWKRSLSISFKIYVPKTVSSNASTSGGSINLSNLTGDQNFTTSGGTLTLDELSGTIKGHTSGGAIKITNSQNKIDLRTSGGSIMADNCRGNIELNTSGGGLYLSKLDGKIDASTSGGSIRGNQIVGELITGTSGGSINLTDLSCSLETSSSAGSIHVSMSALGKYIKINNSVGHVDLKLPAGKGLDVDLRGNRVNATGFSRFDGEKSKSSIVGKINGGGIPVNVKTSIGGINLTM